MSDVAAEVQTVHIRATFINTFMQILFLIESLFSLSEMFLVCDILFLSCLEYKDLDMWDFSCTDHVWIC